MQRTPRRKTEEWQRKGEIKATKNPGRQNEKKKKNTEKMEGTTPTNRERAEQIQAKRRRMRKNPGYRKG